MRQTTYQTLFAKLDSLGCVRKDKTFGCKIGEIYTYIGSENHDYMDAEGFLHEDISDDDKIIGHPSVLSDCMKALYKRLEQFDRYEQTQNCDRLLESFPYDWDYEKPCLKDQSEELGIKLLSLLS